MENKGPEQGGNAAFLNHTAPEVFVSGLMRCDIEAGGIVKLTFGTLHNNMEGDKVAQVVNLRVVMSFPTAENMLQFVGNWMANIKAAHSAPPPGTTVQ